MDPDEFAKLSASYLLRSGRDWAEAEVRRTLAEGIPERKDVSPVSLSDEIARLDDQSAYFSTSEDYTKAFVRKGARKAVEASRPYTNQEKAALYVTALYSVLVEPDAFASLGLKLMGEDIQNVQFSSEDGTERFEVSRATLSEGGIPSELRHALERAVKHAPRS